MRTHPAILVAALGGLLAVAAEGQLPRPIGGQAIANLTRALNQDQAVTAVDAAGNFLVVWRAEGQDGSGTAIVGRRFSGRDGQPLSGEILLNVTPSGDQSRPALAMAADGHFVVAWEGPDASGSVGIFGSLRQADGTPIVPEFPVNTTLAGDQLRPSVAMRQNGDFLVAWQSDATPAKGLLFGKDILGRIFRGAGGPTAEFQLNLLSLGDQEEPAVAADLVTGGWFASWQGVDLLSLVPSIFFQKLLPDGPSPQLIEVVLNLLTPGPRRHARVAGNSAGTAVAVWEGPDGSGTGIFSRTISGGLPIGLQQPVNLTTVGDQVEPSVALDERGFFVTVWVQQLAAEGAEGSPIVVQGRKKSSSAFGEVPPADGEFQVSSSGANPADPWVGTMPSGNFVVAWQAEGVDDPQDPQGRGALYQRFADAIFADDFETADTSRWSFAAP